MSLHLALADLIDAKIAPQLDITVERKQDALILRLTNGVTLTVRYAAADAYSLHWEHAGSEARIDTAPLHPALSTFPNHFHDASGALLPDPLTDPTRAPEDNLRRLVAALLDDPTLGAGAAP